MTRWYWVCSADTVPQAWASSVPAAPPKAAMTSPPEARRLLIAVVQPASLMDMLPLKVALQVPSLRTNPRWKWLTPVEVWAFAMADGEFQVSTQGATYWAGKPGPGLAAAWASGGGTEQGDQRQETDEGGQMSYTHGPSNWSRCETG
ncbi:hypothetical protein [Streptomyces sp. CA-106131]|uniref:hypothetical protein n=1 Tax=Streptomyces sp. CA-106131 TaxID=3240045 RepID=UPI003D8A15E3